jgi:hypothetical protein
MTSSGRLLIGACAVLPVLAGADTLSGEIAIGARNVSVSGTQAKYQEDINLDDGIRLSNVSFLYRRDGVDPLKPDMVEFDAGNLGGDPYENMRLSVRKYGAYSFRAQRRRSSWIYDDIIVLPENASINGSTGGDFHRFDTERVRDDVALTVNLTERATLNMGFERHAKTGSSTTTLDISRDEFEMDKPVDELMESWRVGLSYRWSRISASLEERVHDYENRSTMFLPGFSVGENPGNLTTLDFYFLDAPYTYRGHDHVARVDANPTDRLTISVLGLLGDLDLETRIDERLQGTGFAGQSLQSVDAGTGQISRDTDLFDATVRFALTPQLGVIGGVRYTSLDQSGDVEFTAVEGGQSQWDIDHRTMDLGLAWQVADKLDVSAGWQTQRRDADVSKMQSGSSLTRADSSSDTDGLFVNIDYRPSRNIHINARLNEHDRDDPYSLASPGEQNRYRLRASYRAQNGLRLIARHSRDDRSNDVGKWSASSRQTTLRLSRNLENIGWSVGGTLVDSTQEYQRLVSGGSRQDLFDVAYAADTSYVDASLNWRIEQRWTVGAYWRRYGNDGSFDVSRDDWRALFDVKLPRNYSLAFSYRRVDYVEGGLEYYDADIIEAVLRIAL